MDPARLAVVVVIVVVGAVLAVWYRRRDGRAPDIDGLPRLPAEVVDSAERTWVVFTTPYCASCGAIEESLRLAEPDSRIVRVDASADPDLAERFRVRRAPTVLLAGPGGRVERSFAGADAVTEFLTDA